LDFSGEKAKKIFNRDTFESAMAEFEKNMEELTDPDNVVRKQGEFLFTPSRLGTAQAGSVTHDATP